MFAELSHLEGDKGARGLIRSLPVIESLELPEAAFDIDTPADVSHLWTNLY
jgi:CTP:molybdopterin cytidylyltransferase MocA